MKLHQRFDVLACVAAAPLLFTAVPSVAQTTSSGTSEAVIWECTGSPCPWGSTDAGIALVWPQNSGATSVRHGYTTTKPVYLPAYAANGAVVQLSSGAASLYAGVPIGGSHRVLTTIAAGGVFTVSGLAEGEVLSVQGSDAFSYQIALPTVSPPPTTPPPETPPPETPPPYAGTSSVAVTWTCAGAPCPWGATDSGIAVEWPDVPERISQRYGYTTDKGVYLGAARANGTTITLRSGTAGIYAGAVDAQHRLLSSLSAGGTYTVSGLAANEILSVQGGAAFTYDATLPTYTPPPPPPSTPGTSSQAVIWQCTGSPCPLGASVSQQATVWPAAANPTSAKLGYTATHGVYLPHNYVAGTTITVKSGTATAFIDAPNSTLHNAIATISAGGTYTFTEISAGQVLSLVGNTEFAYELTLGAFVPSPPPPPANVILSTPTEWRCDFADCPGNWYSHTIPWPSWSAYSDNARAGEKFRRTYGPNDEVIHPYMGSWANGCRVTSVSGVVLIIEWQRGSENWRETYLDPGQTYTLHLTPPFDGAMIESYDESPGFSVTLENCTPQPVP